MAVQFLRMVGITTSCGLCIFYPFFPGSYDALAMPLSTAVQLLAAASLLLIPIGVLWLAYDLRLRGRSAFTSPTLGQGLSLKRATWLVASLLVIAVSLLILFGISLALGVILLAAWCYIVSQSPLPTRRPQQSSATTVDPTPLYLIVIPLALLLLQISLAAPLVEFSRHRAITSSTQFVSQLEKYHKDRGHYPVSLEAMWKDYYPNVVAIEKFHYARHGDSFNLFFEQPRLIFDRFGTREWVVFNPEDDHRMFSHTSWLLLLSAQESERSQGWYAAQDAHEPHWRIFWFD